MRYSKLKQIDRRNVQRLAERGDPELDLSFPLATGLLLCQRRIRCISLSLRAHSASRVGLRTSMVTFGVT